MASTRNPVPAAPRDAPAERAIRRWRRLSHLLPGLVLALALAASWSLREWVRQDIERDLRLDFEVHVRTTTGIFRERIQAFERVLYATSGLFAASDSVEPNEFKAFVDSLHIERLPGLQGVGFVRRLPNRRSPTDKTATAALYFEPPAPELSVPGTDYFAEPARRPAMAAARDTGAIAIANKKKLPEEDATRIQGGLRMYLPVYRNGAPRGSEAERRANLAGWVYAAFSMDGLMDNILGERADIAIDVYDGADMLDDRQFFDTPLDRVGGESALKLLTATRPIEIGGYAWTLSAHAQPKFMTPLAAGNVSLFTGAGIAASLLLAGFAWLALRRRIRTLRTNQQLHAAKLRAEEANRAKSRFLAAASHDLRQPTHALGLFITALHAMAKRPHVDGADLEHVATRLQTALNGLGNLLNAILDISRLDAGAVKVSKRAVALIDELANLYDAFSGPAAAKGLELKIVPSSLWVDTDPALLHRILSNLVSNAVRYTEHGRIIVGCRRRADEVAIQVLDTGIGISQDQLALIFTEFYQVGNVARDREQGLGLGLAIVQRSVDILGAQLDVASAPGKGSRFSLVLPLAAAGPAPEAYVPPQGTKNSLTVLAIDDDRDVLDAVETLLTAWGHLVVPARSVEEAVAAAAEESQSINLILADYRLEGERTGVDAIRAVYARLGRTIPAVLVTGDTSPERIREASASGFALLHKPLAPNELYDLLEVCA